ncbi:hypothetical protein Agub_g10545, partial [Astrephomene gubernaculifera]
GTACRLRHEEAYEERQGAEGGVGMPLRLAAQGGGGCSAGGTEEEEEVEEEEECCVAGSRIRQAASAYLAIALLHIVGARGAGTNTAVLVVGTLLWVEAGRGAGVGAGAAAGEGEDVIFLQLVGAGVTANRVVVTDAARDAMKDG